MSLLWRDAIEEKRRNAPRDQTQRHNHKSTSEYTGKSTNEFTDEEIVQDLMVMTPGDRLTDDEIVSTLQLMVAAGHETTISLIVNAVVNLSTHPEQRASVLSGEADWSAVIEETLRYSTPTSHVLIRFATEDVPVGDQVLPAGDALIVSYGALGRDEAAHGPSAGDFDITRPTAGRHISVGYGPHVCPGAALSRLEAGVALPALYARFPSLDLAVPADELRNKPVVTQNDLFELPVRLGR